MISPEQQNRNVLSKYLQQEKIYASTDLQKCFISTAVPKSINRYSVSSIFYEFKLDINGFSTYKSDILWLTKELEAGSPQYQLRLPSELETQQIQRVQHLHSRPLSRVIHPVPALHSIPHYFHYSDVVTHVANGNAVLSTITYYCSVDLQVARDIVFCLVHADAFTLSDCATFFCSDNNEVING